MIVGLMPSYDNVATPPVTVRVEGTTDLPSSCGTGVRLPYLAYVIYPGAPQVEVAGSFSAIPPPEGVVNEH